MPAATGTTPFERAVYGVDHALVVDGVDVPAFTMALLTPGSEATVVSPLGSRYVVLGGEPLDGRRIIWWNFVSSSRERIEQAKEDWTSQRMGQIEGEHEWIPLPPDARRTGACASPCIIHGDVPVGMDLTYARRSAAPQSQRAA